MRRLWLLPFILFLIFSLHPSRSLLPSAVAKPDPGGFYPVAWGNVTGYDADGGPALWVMGAGERFGKIWVDGQRRTWGKPWLRYGYCSGGYGAPDVWGNPSDYPGVEEVVEATPYSATWNLTTTGHPAAYIYSLQTAWYGYPWMKIDASLRFKTSNTVEVRYHLTEAETAMYNFTIPKVSGYYGGTAQQIGYGEQKVYDNSTESLADNWIVIWNQDLDYIYVIALVELPEAIYMHEYGGRWISVTISYGPVDGAPGQVVDLPPVYMGFYNHTHDKGVPFASYDEICRIAEILAHAMLAEPDYSGMSEDIVSEGGGLATIRKTMGFIYVDNDWGITPQPLIPSCPWAENVLNSTLLSYEGVFKSSFQYVSGTSIHYQLLRPRIVYPAYGRPIISSDPRFNRLLNHTLLFVDGLKYQGLFWKGYWASFFSRVGFILDTMDDPYADTYWTTWIGIQTTPSDPHLQSWQSPIPDWLMPLVNNTWWRGYVWNETTQRWEMSDSYEAGFEMWSTDYTPRILWGLYYHYLVFRNETYRALMEDALLRGLKTLDDYSWMNPDFKAWYYVYYNKASDTWGYGRHGLPGHESGMDEILAYYSAYLLTGDDNYLIKALKIHALNFKFFLESRGYDPFMGGTTVARLMPHGYGVRDMLYWSINRSEYRTLRPGCVTGGDPAPRPDYYANTYYSACALMALMALGDVENATRFWRFLADAQEISERESGDPGGICDGWNASTNMPIWGVHAVDTAGWILGALSYTLNATLQGDTLYFRVNIPENWTRFKGYAKGEGQLIYYELEGEDEHLIFEVSDISTIRYRLRQPERAIIRVKKDGRTIYNWRVEDGELIIPGLTGTTVKVFVIDPHPYIVKLYMALVGLASASTSIIAALRRRLGGRISIMALLAILTLTLILVAAARWVISLLLQGVAI